jgi:hypothetical protein
MTSLRAATLLLVSFCVVACSRNDAPGGYQPEAAENAGNSAQKPDRKVSGLPAGALHAQRVAVMDMNGFEQPLPALFALVPVGWRTQGGVTWGRQFMCTNGYNFNWVAQSPDGLQTVAILPQYKWEANNYGASPSSPGCQSASITSIQQYLNAVVNQMRPGARIVDFRPRPDLAAKFSNLQQTTPTAMGDMRTWIEAGEVLVDYQENGRAMRGVIAAPLLLDIMWLRSWTPPVFPVLLPLLNGAGKRAEKPPSVERAEYQPSALGEPAAGASAGKAPMAHASMHQPDQAASQVTHAVPPGAFEARQQAPA